MCFVCNRLFFSEFIWLVTVTCMWSGGISKRNPVRPAGEWAQGLTCQTAKTPACHIQNPKFTFSYLITIKQKERKSGIRLRYKIGL